MNSPITFRIASLDASRLPKALSSLATRVTATTQPGYPCRVSLQDAAPGEALLLFHHLHRDDEGPYRASGPIYIREHAEARHCAPGEVPDMLRPRLLSLRAYDARGWLIAADVVPGTELEGQLITLLTAPDVVEVDIHNARHGCYLCRAASSPIPG